MSNGAKSSYIIVIKTTSAIAILPDHELLNKKNIRNTCRLKVSNLYQSLHWQVEDGKKKWAHVLTIQNDAL